MSKVIVATIWEVKVDIEYCGSGVMDSDKIEVLNISIDGQSIIDIVTPTFFSECEKVCYEDNEEARDAEKEPDYAGNHADWMCRRDREEGCHDDY